MPDILIRGMKNRDAIPYKKIMFDDDDFYYGVTQPYIDRMPVIVPASEEVEK